MKIDHKTEAYFKNIKQVFLYLSDKCNLFCTQCLYKPNVVMGRFIKKEIAKSLLEIFSNLGAYKLTVLGGEISLYDTEHRWSDLREILSYAHKLGYRYIRIDTNGQNKDFFQGEENFNFVDEVSFSIDGYNENTHDILRGKGTFQEAIKSIAILKGIGKPTRINITSCVTKQNVGISKGVNIHLTKMIDFARDLNLNQINFHGVFKMGVPMDTWTGDSHLHPNEWYEAVREFDVISKNNIDIRLPLHVISHIEFEKHPDYYGYCPCKIGERALVHPDGIIRVCSSMLSTPYGVAHYNDDEIVWNEYNNELSKHEMNRFTPCTNQRALYTDDLYPICFSIKPFQNEIVWNETAMERRKLVINCISSTC